VPPVPLTRPAPTLTGLAVGQWVFRCGNDVRNLDVPDALRLQTFPAGYPTQGTKGQQGQQIGNAVPPRLARHILEAVQ